MLFPLHANVCMVSIIQVKLQYIHVCHLYSCVHHKKHDKRCVDLEDKATYPEHFDLTH